jgi:two-component system, chemotaxis family, CheB/CheR fusion protein
MVKQISKKNSQKSSEKTKTTKLNKQPIAVVGIGASAGGLEAFSQLLKNLPDDTGMAFVLIQHLDPKHKSTLTEILGRVTKIPVKQITQNITAVPNHVYAIPPNKYLHINKGKLILSERVKTDGTYLPIDFFFHSLGSDQKNKAIGIILSGTASDGTVGLKSIKAEGGLTFAQDELSAKYPGMPHSAIRSGNVDVILPPEKIAKELVRIAKHPYIALNPKSKTEKENEKEDNLEETKEDSLTELYSKLKKTAGVDFSNYKINTVKRRINRRMVINKIKKIEDYVKFVKEDKNEVMNLYHDLLINVTNFFRDPEVFEVLTNKIYPKLIKNNSENSLRIWVPGCATGEEVYSIAISLLEFLDKKASKFSIQIFATDISEPSIDRARAGIYPESVIAAIPSEIQRKYFNRLNGSYQVSKLLRELCIFARQDISKDPPFSKLDLISCRNLLIYLSPELQKKIIPIFHYALKPNGYLLLGTSESIGNYYELFQIADKKFKIYQRKEYQKRIGNNFSFTNIQYPTAEETKYQNFPDELEVLREADKIILGKYAPAAILVNHNLEIIQFRGRIKNYLDPVPGNASLNLFKMIKEGINVELHTSIRKASDTKKSVTIENINIDVNGISKYIDLEVVPLKTSQDLKGLSFLILFNEHNSENNHETKGELKKGNGIKSSQNSDRRIEKLKEELSVTKEHLQSIIQQREAANEELRSALEELQSSNEELQSTNEEMETAKEELQSTNEELMTVNYELESRNMELDEANSHLNNILSSINIPIVLLGRDLTIKRFTQKAENIWNLIPSDIGRPFSHLKPNFEVPDLKEKILDVMDELESIEFEIKDNDNKSYSMKIRPYKASDNKIEGAIILLYDIDLLKKVAVETERKNYFEAIHNTLREPILILNKDLKVVSANKSFYDTFKLNQKKTVGKYVYDLGNKQWDIPALKKLLENILPKNNFFDNYEIEHKFSANGTKKMLLNARKIEAGDSREELILLAFEKVR